MSAAAAGAAAGAAATATALRATGVIVHLDSEQFLNLISREERPLVVHAAGGLLWPSYQYLTSYRGLVFYTLTAVPLPLPKGTELITANRIWAP